MYTLVINLQCKSDKCCASLNMNQVFSSEMQFCIGDPDMLIKL